MSLEIHGLTECLFLDIILLWAFVCLCILGAIMMLGCLFLDNGILSINDNNIIEKIIKLKNTDKKLYNFANKLNKDNIQFLIRYKLDKFERIVILNKNQKLERFLFNENDKRLYKKIESIIYYYDLIHK